MSVWPDPVSQGAALRGAEGELVSIRISVEPRLLEELLEILARLDFPINPQLYHHHAATIVEFPAWAGRLEAIREALRRSGLGSAELAVRDMLADIRHEHAEKASA
jgi:hypothetical protein